MRYWAILTALALILPCFGATGRAAAADLPDLVVTAIEVTPATAYTGDAVQFTATVKNQGTAATPQGVIIGVVAYVDGNFVGYSDQYSASLAPGASVQIPIRQGGSNAGSWTAAEGTHTVSCLVDDVNRIAESGETNNSYTRPEPYPVATLNGPDLVVRDLAWSPDLLVEGQAVTFRATLVNQGNQTVPQGSGPVVWFLVDDRIIAASAPYTGALSPGQSVAMTGGVYGGNASDAWIGAAGGHILSAVADALGTVAETRETNNRTDQPMVLGAPVTEQARQADAFVDSIGVTTHLFYYDTSYNRFDDIIKPKLIQSGIRHIREGASKSDTHWKRLRELADNGIHASLLFDPRGMAVTEAVYIASGLQPAVEAIEGPNEYNNSGNANWVQTFRDYTISLHDKLKADSRTAGLPIWGGTTANDPNAYNLIGDLSAYVDYGNIHPYPGGGVPAIGLAGSVSMIQPSFGGLPVIASESGYHTFNGCSGTQCSQPGVTESAEAIYMPRMFLDYFNAGIARTYAYEFIDEKKDSPASDQEQHFGLLRFDGSEKPAFKAIQSLIGLLQEPGASFAPGSLTYAVNGNTEDLHHTLLQKSDGTQYLLLWLDKKSFDTSANQNIDVPTQQLTLDFGQARTAAVYTLDESGVLSHTAPAASRYVNLKVDDHVAIVQLGGTPWDAGSGAPSGLTTVYEAEAGTVAGGAAVANDSKASGGKKVGNLHLSGASVTVSVYGGSGGESTLAITYATGIAYPSKSLYVNGTLIKQLILPPTGGWNTFATLTATIPLSPGTNTIMIKNNMGDYGGIDVDKLTVTVNGPAAGTGGQTAAFYDGFSGPSATGWTLYGGTWTVYAGNYAVDRGPGYKAVADGTGFADGTLKADISSASGGYAGILFRASQPGVGRYAFNGYFAGVDSGGKVILGKAGAGANTWTTIATAQTAPASGWYHLEVKAEGSRIKVYVGVGTEPVIDAVDTAYSSGTAGVRADNAAARFDNFRILTGL